MPLVKSVNVDITVKGTEDAKLKIEDVRVKAEELKRLNPEITPKIDSAKALVEARILRAGLKAEFEKSITETVNVRQSALSRLVGASGLGPGGGSGFLSGLDNLPLGGLGGITALLPVIGAVLVEATALVSGLAAATAGVGAFGALAIPTFKNIATAYTGIAAAQKKYNDAVELQKADPTKTHAKDVAAALTQLKIAQKDMSPSTKAAVDGIQALVKSYDALAKAFAPDVMKVFNDGLKIANQLLPTLLPFAKAAAGAIDGLLKQFDKFTKSSGFKTWLDQFRQLAGPAITAIGQGIGRVVTNLGKLFTTFSAKDVTHGINIAIDIISGSIKALTYVVTQLKNHWTEMSSGFVAFAQNVGPPILKFISIAIGAFNMLNDAVLASIGGIIDGFAKAFGFLPGIGGKLKDAAKAFDGFRQSVHDNLSTAQKNLDQWAKDLTNMPKIVKIKGDISDMQEKLKQAKAQLKDPVLKGETSQIKGNISQLEAEIARAKAELARLNGTTATTYVITQQIGGPRAIAPTAHRAGGGYASGMTLVGERGPELVSLPSGSYVHTAAQSRQMMSGNTYVINQYSLVPSAENGRQIVNALKQFERGSGSSWRK